MARTHDLKTWPEPFDAVVARNKRFEIRRNDRDFQVDDVLNLRKFDPAAGVYTGETCQRRVTFILEGGQFGLEPGFVAMGIEPIGEIDSIRAAFEHEMAEDEAKAWDAMARYKFWMFGYHASDWVKNNRRSGLGKPNPFAILVQMARERGFGPPGTERSLLRDALRLAKDHISHMSAWIASQQGGYSFEALGEDMGTIDAALASLTPEKRP